ncbi:MAG: hypothetical protein ABSA75_13475 [Candidatus Bathyarchaeia archaeon]|jgi:hypothetical protein
MLAASSNSQTKKYIPSQNDLQTLGEGSAIITGQDPHKSNFTQTTNALDPATWNIKDLTSGLNSSLATNPSLMLDKNGKPIIMPVFIVDPTGASSLNSATIDAYGQANPLPIGVINTVSGLTEIPRTPTWYANAQCTTVAATVLKAATAGKKHRVLGGVIVCGAGMGAAGIELINILDVAADIGLDFATYLPIAATLSGIGVSVIPFDLKPNGYLCAAVNTAINVTLGTAITAGTISVTLWGTDE